MSFAEELHASPNLSSETHLFNSTDRDRPDAYSYQSQVPGNGQSCKLSTSTTSVYLLAQCMVYQISLIFFFAAQPHLLLDLRMVRQHCGNDIGIVHFRVVQVLGFLDRIKQTFHKQVPPRILEHIEGLIKTARQRWINRRVAKARIIPPPPNITAKNAGAYIIRRFLDTGAPAV